MQSVFISHPSSVKTVPGNTSHPPSVGLGDGWLPPLPVASRTRRPGRVTPWPQPTQPPSLHTSYSLGLDSWGPHGGKDTPGNEVKLCPQTPRTAAPHSPWARGLHDPLSGEQVGNRCTSGSGSGLLGRGSPEWFRRAAWGLSGCGPLACPSPSVFSLSPFCQGGNKMGLKEYAF